MAKKGTVEKINYDSARSNMERMAAGSINTTRKRNGHINEPLAVAMMARDCNISTSEARIYVEGVISDANDMEWQG